MHLRALGALAGSVVLAPLLATDAHAQACVTEARSDFINYSYTPSRPFSLRNGQVFSLASNSVAADHHNESSTTTVVFPPLTAPTQSLKAVVNYDVLNGHAEVWTALFGYGEAGIEVHLEARNSAGVVVCTDSEVLYIARYNERGELTPGPRPRLECELGTGFTGPVTLETTSHAWVTVGGLTTAGAALGIQVVSSGVESCTGSCSSTCGPVASSGGTCFCDDLCSSFGDCCANVAEVCELDSCWEQCGGVSAGGSCFCDDACTGFGDCCSDFADSCG